MKIQILLTMLLSACASSPKCQTQGAASAIYMTEKSCDVRIRQVEVGSTTSGASTVRDSDRFVTVLDWVDATYENGQIKTGHFLKTQKLMDQTNGR
jgi:hypothetical protein